MANAEQVCRIDKLPICLGSEAAADERLGGRAGAEETTSTGTLVFYILSGFFFSSFWW